MSAMTPASFPAESDQPPSIGVVATDGGPVLLGPVSALETWAGSRADGAPEGDYFEACQAARHQGTLQRGHATVMVLPTSVVDVLEPGDGTLWLTLEGMIEELWAAREQIVFRSLDRSIEVVAEMALLDAAWPLDAATADSDRFLPLSLRPGRYALDIGSESEVRGYFQVLRLRACD
jgi:hypothetical protein